MLKNYLLSIYRNLKRDRLYSLINLAGLSIGLSCFLFIAIFVYEESRYDAFHREADRLYRVITEMTNEEGATLMAANTYSPVGPLLESGFPGVEAAVRYFPYSGVVEHPAKGEIFHEDAIFFADSLFFTFFSFPFQEGDPVMALQRPDAVVLTASAARRYFGESPPVGQSLELDNKKMLTVTAVIEDVPELSSLQFDMIVAMPALAEVMGEWVFNSDKSWHYPPMYTVVRLPEGNTPEQLEAHWPQFEQNHLPGYIREMYSFAFQPLRDVHFTQLEGDLLPATSWNTLYLFVLIGIVILTIACINVVNLQLSQLFRRVREFGIRRALGARPRQVLEQMGLETILLLGVSLVVAFILVQAGLPGTQLLFDRMLSWKAFSSPWLWSGLGAAMLLMTGFITGIPYWFFSRTQTARVLKGEEVDLSKRKSGFSFRDSFVVFQFTAAVALLIAALVIRFQVDYVHQKDLGWQREQLLVIPIQEQDELQKNFDAVKNNLLEVPGVASVSAISNFPWEQGYYGFPVTIEGQGVKAESDAGALLVDPDFIETMGMQIAMGRTFSRDFGSDAGSAFLINEKMAEKYGIRNLEGLTVTGEDMSAGDPKKGRIIGIVEDFHLKSLHHPVDPLVLTVAPAYYYLDNIVMRLRTADIPGTLTALNKRWETLAPERPFEYFFLDETFEALYRKESRLANLFSLFTGLALVIAGMGLFALAAFHSRQRRREIGIRKVLGAGLKDIVELLSKDFMRLILIAFVIATPAAWWMMNRWLQDFAYRIQIEWWMIAMAGAGALLIALLTVSYHALRAGMADPVRALREE